MEQLTKHVPLDVTMMPVAEEQELVAALSGYQSITVVKETKSDTENSIGDEDNGQQRHYYQQLISYSTINSTTSIIKKTVLPLFLLTFLLLVLASSSYTSFFGNTANDNYQSNKLTLLGEPVELTSSNNRAYLAPPIDGTSSADWEKYKQDLTSEMNSKKITFIRHGEAIHNVVANFEDLKDVKYLDAPLTDRGKEDAYKRGKMLIEHFGTNWIEQFDIFISSPLTRALQTAEYLLIEYNRKQRRLRQQQQQQQHTNRNPLTIHVQEQCRETIGVYPCDERRNTTVLQSVFPEYFDFSQLASVGDTLWTMDNRETEEERAERARRFLKQVMSSSSSSSPPSTSILVFSHEGFISACLEQLHVLKSVGSVKNLDAITVAID